MACDPRMQGFLLCVSASLIKSFVPVGTVENPASLLYIQVAVNYVARSSLRKQRIGSFIAFSLNPSKQPSSTTFVHLASGPLRRSSKLRQKSTCGWTKDT